MERECVEAYQALLSEVTKGMEQVKQLRAAFPSNQDTFLERMASSYEEALLILNGSAPEEQCRSMISSASDPSDSSSSVCKVTQSDVSSWDPMKRKDCQEDIRNSKYQRWEVQKWTQIIKVRNETGVEETPNDGYAWRKYGQKDILGAAYPRSYFRCSHRFGQGCLATKQVQRSTEDPSVLEITYLTKHTCRSTITRMAAPKLAPLDMQEHDHKDGSSKSSTPLDKQE